MDASDRLIVCIILSASLTVSSCSAVKNITTCVFQKPGTSTEEIQPCSDRTDQSSNKSGFSNPSGSEYWEMWQQRGKKGTKTSI